METASLSNAKESCKGRFKSTLIENDSYMIQSLLYYYIYSSIRYVRELFTVRKRIPGRVLMTIFLLNYLELWMLSLLINYSTVGSK
jgi:hypothetical protein